MDDVNKKIEALEKRIKELESKLKSNLQMFGRSYSQAGDTNSDFLIKTRGLVKILYGGKFIDLIKDGKINVDSKFLFKGAVGVKDGIYVDGENIWLKIGNENPISLKGEIGTTYVSFFGEQETSSDEKRLAYINIGLLAETQENVKINSGLVYIESENKLYLVNNGNIEEFKINFPNPFPELFIISKTDSKQGSLLITGTGINNSLAFNGLYIYTDSNSIIESDNNIIFNIGKNKLLELSKYLSVFYNDVIANTFKCDNNKFKLYYSGGQSYLEVDNLKVNNKSSDLEVVNDELWFSTSNVISGIEILEEENELYSNFYITLSQTNLFKVDDILVTFRKEEKTYPEEEEEEEEEYTIIELTPIYFKVLSSETNTIKVESIEPLEEDLIEGLATIYKVSPECPIRIKNNNLDIVEYPDNIKTRIGDLSELGYENYGIYTDNFIIKNLGNIVEIINNLNEKISNLTTRVEALEL